MFEPKWEPANVTLPAEKGHAPPCNPSAPSVKELRLHTDHPDLETDVPYLW